VKLIVGLGNPGAEYERTRHNAGFMAVDRLIGRCASGEPVRAKFHAGAVEGSIPGAGKALFLKPTTYMNRSGLSVGEAMRFYKLDPQEDLLVLVDDVALPVGTIRLRASGGDGGHNGLADITRVLSGADYPRLRIGIGDPGPVPQRDYVLRRFSQEELSELDPALDRAADAAEVWACEGAAAAMNQFNVKQKGFAPKPSEGEEAPAGNGAA
jgi:PTH1 family peptidyl-tRNA hydrolase